MLLSLALFPKMYYCWFLRAQMPRTSFPVAESPGLHWASQAASVPRARAVTGAAAPRLPRAPPLPPLLPRVSQGSFVPGQPCCTPVNVLLKHNDANPPRRSPPRSQVQRAARTV